MQQTLSPHARRPVPGSADLCFILGGEPREAIDQAQRQLAEHGVPIELGPVNRTGALGTIESLYVRDPDGNLSELSAYPQTPAAG